jgi:hypothetical protein
MTMFQKICVSVLFAFFMVAMCMLLLMSGGVFFGPLAYVGIALLWPSEFVSRFIFGADGNFVFGLSLAFMQFFILSFWLITKISAREVR